MNVFFYNFIVHHEDTEQISWKLGLCVDILDLVGPGMEACEQRYQNEELGAPKSRQWEGKQMDQSILAVS